MFKVFRWLKEKLIVRDKIIFVYQGQYTIAHSVSHNPSTGRVHPFPFNTLRPRQNGRHFADDNFKHIFLNENARISIEISLKFVPKGPMNNIPALVQIMAWRRPGDKPLSGPMMDKLPTHICVTRPQWVNDIRVNLPNLYGESYIQFISFSYLQSLSWCEVFSMVSLTFSWE